MVPVPTQTKSSEAVAVATALTVGLTFSVHERPNLEALAQLYAARVIEQLDKHGIRQHSFLGRELAKELTVLLLTARNEGLDALAGEVYVEINGAGTVK
jgi:hypothetical protein